MPLLPQEASYKKGLLCLEEQIKRKGKGQNPCDGHVMQVTSSSSSMKIEETNAICDDDVDILVMDDDATYVEVNMALSLAHTWLLDYGASFHVTPQREWFTRYEAKPLGIVRLGDSSQCDVVGIRDVLVQFSNGSQFPVQNVHHVSELTCSLMSTGQLDDVGYKVIFAS